MCKKTFAWKHQLTAHEAVHRRIKKYACEVCNKEFANSSNIKEYTVVLNCLTMMSITIRLLRAVS